ncbi:MAG: element excision factor XisH family protein [Candidatus Binatia bacterium]
MATRDIYHDAVKQALVTEGWIVTHDPFVIPFGVHNLFVDLGAERWLAAEKAGQRIAVEIKSFVGRSPINDLENALGQYVLYRSLLSRREPERAIYLAIPLSTYESLFSTPLGQVAIEDHGLKLIVFDPAQEEIRQWIE